MQEREVLVLLIADVETQDRPAPHQPQPAHRHFGRRTALRMRLDPTQVLVVPLVLGKVLVVPGGLVGDEGAELGRDGRDTSELGPVLARLEPEFRQWLVVRYD